MASPGNRHCANCIGTFSFPIVSNASAKRRRLLVYSFLDYGNRLSDGVSDELQRKLQVVQNAAARLVAGARKFDHAIYITLVL